MTPQLQDDRHWAVRSFVYEHFAANERPPSTAETAQALGITAGEAQAAYEHLNRIHAIFLDPDDRTIRMANPFSGIPTAYQVRTGNRTYWANCAWDSLGIPAALDTDATIHAVCPDTQVPIEFSVEAGQVRGHGELVHFPIPFRRWYDDLILT